MHLHQILCSKACACLCLMKIVSCVVVLLHCGCCLCLTFAASSAFMCLYESSCMTCSCVLVKQFGLFSFGLLAANAHAVFHMHHSDM